MIYVKRILLLALIALLMVFAFQNQRDLGTPVTLAFLKWQQTLVLGFWLLLSFLAGAVLFILVDMLRSFSLRRELARRTQELSRAQVEVARLQALPLGSQPPSRPGQPPMSPGRREAGATPDLEKQ
ncbi:MAG TPA: LapA family protein [Fibrobacteria bacterium]|nr:LapA family protein [Fibrobacteria bacterium]